MDLDAIKGLIAAMASSDLSEMEFSENGWTLRLLRGERVPEQAPVARLAAQTIDAPIGGIVHLQPAPGAPAFVRAGQPVSAGAPLCMIEAMKVFNTVHAEHDATIEAVLVETGAEVDAGQPLLRLA